MEIDIVLGAQYGREGKSKFVRYFSEERAVYDGAIKIGGYSDAPYYDRNKDKMMVSKMIPVANSLVTDMVYIFPRCCYVDMKLLKEEADERKIPYERIMIDPDARVMTEEGSETIARHIPYKQLNGIEIHDVSEFLAEMEDYEFRAIIEAQGGWGLAKDIMVYHNKKIFMPPPSMTAAGIVSLLELSYSKINDVILVTKLGLDDREFPKNRDINVWEILRKNLDEKYPIKEETIDREMLLGMYNSEDVISAIIANDPTILVLNFLDKLDGETEEITEGQLNLVENIEEEMGTTFDYIGNSPRCIRELELPDEGIVDQAFPEMKSMSEVKGEKND